MNTTARRAFTTGTIAAFLTAAGAVSGLAADTANAYTTTTEAGTVRLVLSPDEGSRAQTDAAFRIAACADVELQQMLSAAGITVTSADCQGYVVWCASSDVTPGDGYRVVFSRTGISCGW